MTTIDRPTITGAVLEALTDVLGYKPAEDDDLVGAMDSMQKLEVVITLEEAFDIDFDDESLDGNWWATPANIVGFFERKVTGTEA
jgi:acyl carrier protein